VAPKEELSQDTRQHAGIHSEEITARHAIDGEALRLQERKGTVMIENHFWLSFGIASVGPGIEFSMEELLTETDENYASFEVVWMGNGRACV
jgi:hypothetical protein